MPEGGLLGGELRLAGRLDERFFTLLAAIDATGSINRAARVAGYTYKGAWLLLETAQNLAFAPLLTTATGGRGGGGTQLTAEGRALLATWRELHAAHRAFLRTQEDRILQLPALTGLLKRLCMKTTARNQFVGTVSAVDTGPVTTEVTLTLAGGQDIAATLTTGAARRLQLAPGREAIALIKSAAIVLETDFAGYQLSARNQLAGTVSRVEAGAASSLVALTLLGGTIVTASVTPDAVSALALAVGQPATAVFKANSVLLAVATG